MSHCYCSMNWFDELYPNICLFAIARTKKKIIEIDLKNNAFVSLNNVLLINLHLFIIMYVCSSPNLVSLDLIQ